MQRRWHLLAHYQRPLLYTNFIIDGGKNQLSIVRYASNYGNILKPKTAFRRSWSSNDLDVCTLCRCGYHQFLFQGFPFQCCCLYCNHHCCGKRLIRQNAMGFYLPCFSRFVLILPYLRPASKQKLAFIRHDVNYED